MNSDDFSLFFQSKAAQYLQGAIDFALTEDGSDLTSIAVFAPQTIAKAILIAKEKTLLCGLPLIPLILQSAAKNTNASFQWQAFVKEGSLLEAGTKIALIEGQARLILQIERVLLNFIMRLSGIANTTKLYVDALKGTGVTLLDTRKTSPCLRYPEKYAVRIGGGQNHRLDLCEMLMLKDNHIDAAGSITQAVTLLRNNYKNTIPIEVECRNLAEVEEAVSCTIDRIMLDNMPLPMQIKALDIIPQNIEVELSGNMTLATINEYAMTKGKRQADFISVGRITHSAPTADFSLIIQTSQSI